MSARLKRKSALVDPDNFEERPPYSVVTAIITDQGLTALALLASFLECDLNQIRPLYPVRGTCSILN